MSTSTPTTYIFNEYEVPYEYNFTKLSAIPQTLSVTVNSNGEPDDSASSEFRVIDAIIKKIWDVKEFKAENNLNNTKEHYTASFQVVEGVKPETEGEGAAPTNILLGYAVHATGAVGSVKKTTRKQGRKGTQDSASGKYNEAYIIIYVIDNDSKAICKVWKVVDDAVNDMIFTYQNVGVKYVRDGLDGSKTLLGWDSEVVDGKTKYYFYLPKMSALLEGMHKPVIANAEVTKFTAAQMPYVITYVKSTSS